jgi:nucleoside phosphorylase
MAGGAGGTVTHFGCGLEVSGATQLVFFGAVTPNIAVVAGVTAKLDTGTVITQAADGMANAAATALLTLFFNNTAWANVGNAGGLLPSSVAGSLYLSLHTSSPAEAGTQATNEISYT